MSEADRYAVGEVARANATFANTAGQAADPSTVAFRYRNPAGVETTLLYGTDPEVVKDGVGLYHTDVLIDLPGDYQWRYLATGVVAVAGEGSWVGWTQFTGTASLYTYDLSTSIGQLRLAIDDRDLSRVSAGIPLEKRSAIWSDGELDSLLTNAGGSVFLAAARALTILANNRSLLVQSRKIGENTVDYGPIRADLLKSAAAFREEADREAGGDRAPASGFAEQAWTEFAARRIVNNGVMRDLA